jgi:hypothetical protein
MTSPLVKVLVSPPCTPRPADLVGRGRLTADNRSARDECRAALEHVDDVGVLRVDFDLSFGVAAARVNHVVPLVHEDGTLRECRGHLIRRDVGHA